VDLIIAATLDTTIPDGGSFIITVPDDITVYSSGLSCSAEDEDGNSISVDGCSASGQVLTVEVGEDVSPNEQIQVTVENSIDNPTDIGETGTFTVETRDASDTTLDTTNSGSALMGLSNGELTNLAFTPDTDVVGATATLTVSFTTGNDVPADGLILIYFPLWNPDATYTYWQEHYFQGSLSCSAVTNLDTDLSCSYDEDDQLLTVSNGIPSALGDGTSLSFQVSGFRNPMSGAEATGFSVYTASSDSDSIDTATTTLTVSTAADFDTSSFAVHSSVSSSVSGIVQETNKMRLTFTPSVPLNEGCKLKVLLPSEFY
jgi:hypothetical protein